MTQKTRSLLTATAFLAILALPFLAEAAARPPVNPGEILRSPRLLARYLKLTSAQLATFRTLHQALQADLKPLRDQLGPLQEQLRTQLEAASPDACAAGQTVVAIDSVRDDIRAAYEELDDAFSAILTAQQLQKYENLKEAAGLFEEEG